VEPGFYGERSLEELFYNGDAISRYEFEGAYGFVDVGRAFGTRSKLRAGIRYGTQAAKRDIAVPQVPEIDAEGYAGWTLGFAYEDRDAAALATHGWLGRLRCFRSEESLGAAHDYDRLECMLVRSLPQWGNLLYLRGVGGTSFGTPLPLYDSFALGGPTSLPGLSTGQLRGDS